MASASEPIPLTELPSDSQPDAHTGRSLETTARRRRQEPPSATPGARIGRYVVVGVLGRGAMGTVLRVYDEQLDRAVALKLLRRGTSRRHAERLRREAQGLAKLSHPNVVQVYEVGQVEGQWFIAMELVQGQTLRRWQSKDRSWREHVEVYLGAGAGLAAAHQVGLVHRDFKPENCIVDEQGRARVLDFGLVRQAGAASEHGGLSASGDPGWSGSFEDAGASNSLTRTGAVLGTAAYMPLEQFEARPTDARSDQFGFCVALYEALYGQRPFDGDGVGTLMVSLSKGQVRPAPAHSRVPARLRRALVRGLATLPEDRWPSMEVLLAELRRIVAPRRLGPWIAGGMGLGLAAAAVVFGMQPSPQAPSPCQGAAEQLGTVWNDARRESVRTAILRTELSYAADTWDRVEQRLDEYASGWVERHVDACEATHVRHEQSAEAMDLRMACLRGGLVSLRESVDVLAGANDARVGKAVEMVLGLPELSACDDVEALSAQLRAPADPQRAEAVQRLREGMSSVRSLRRLGEYDVALARVEDLVEQAESIGYEPVLAEVLQLRGELRMDKGHFAESEQDLLRAYVLAIEQGHRSVETKAALSLVLNVGHRQARFDQGLQWATTALALSRAPHARPSQESTALSSIALVLEGQGKLDEALEHHRQSLASLERTQDPDRPNLAHMLNNVGIVLQYQGKLDEALTYHERAQAIREQVLGSEHPDVAASLVNSANVMTLQGRREEALEHHLRALQILERALGSEHPDIATSVMNVGVVLSTLGRDDEALPYYERALRGRERALGPDHPEVGAAAINLGFMLRGQGRYDEALKHHRRALSIFTAALDPEHRNVALAHNNIGLVMLDQEQLASARSHFERALTIWERRLGAEHPNLAYSLLGLANVALARSDDSTARRHAERAVSILSSAQVSPDRLAEARFVLARALWSDRTQQEQAVALAGQAQRVYDKGGEPFAEALAETRAWLEAHPLR